MSKIIVIVGPTGVGKTKLSIALAQSFNGEIINGDSMQVYQGLDIGTAKITQAEQMNIPHHLLDIKKVDDNYTVFDYQQDGRKIIDELLEQKKTPIIVGGTGLYIKALLYDYQFNKEIIKNNYDELTNQELYDRVKTIDSESDIHLNNRKRLIRVLNRYENNDDNIDTNQGNNLLYDVIFIGLTTDRTILYDKLNSRVDKMINDGLMDEVKTLYDQGIKSKAIMTGIGYKELYQYFDNKLSLNETINLIKKNTRNYAKRQYTWFNNKMNIIWFDVNFNDFKQTINDIKTYIKGQL